MDNNIISKETIGSEGTDIVVRLESNAKGFLVSVIETSNSNPTGGQILEMPKYFESEKVAKEEFTKLVREYRD